MILFFPILRQLTEDVMLSNVTAELQNFNLLDKRYHKSINLRKCLWQI